MAEVLDWRHPRHWSQYAKPCRYCGCRTNLRDEAQLPAHKTCAEQPPDVRRSS